MSTSNCGRQPSLKRGGICAREHCKQAGLGVADGEAISLLSLAVTRRLIGRYAERIRPSDAGACFERGLLVGRQDLAA